MKSRNILWGMCLALLFISFNAVTAQTDRQSINDRYKWDLTPIFANEEVWQQAKAQVTTQMQQIAGFKGKLAQSPQQLLACLNLISDLQKQASNLAVFVSMNADLDTRNQHYQALEKELNQLFTDFGTAAAFIEPEIIEAGKVAIDKYLQQEPGLKVYSMMLDNLFRQQAHVLSEKEERIMALTSMISGNGASAYNVFSNAEMPSPEVVLSTGEKVELNNAGYNFYRASSNRADRQLVFNAYWANWKKYEATMGEFLGGSVREEVFRARARNYESSLDATLFGDNIPVEVYYSLVSNVNKNLDAFHRYLKIKARLLGVDTLHYSDMYAPVVKNINSTYSYDDAQKLVVNALKPLGEDYISTLQKAFSHRWIDVYPTTGKRSGAYSNGGAYDVHPYILLNYNGQYNEVSTLAHELGHTMHSYYSNKNQPYPLADYSIFNAEVASTFNEVLLFENMKKQMTSDDQRLALLMDWLDRFKGTLFRQTQFAEFELRIHEAANKGEALTGEVLTRIYGDILNRYYGGDKGICVIDKNCDMEWAFIPHFYNSFYVYQYSTSFTASLSLAADVMANKPGALQKYTNYLSAGCTKYPIDLLRDAGVDMTTSQPFDNAIAAMNKVMDEIEALLNHKK
jgi:oligoendopeptidase F